MTLVGDRPTGPDGRRPGRLVDRFERGLDAPICLTWELTYACNLACVHCLSSSGRRDPRRADHRRVPGADRRVRAHADLLRQHRRRRADRAGRLLGPRRVRHRPPRRGQVLDQRVPHHRRRGRAAGATDYVDVQISLDGATAEVNDAVRGAGSYATAITAMGRLAAAGFAGFKLSVVVTRHNVGQLDAFKAPRRPATGPSSASPGCGRRAGGPTSGTSSIPTADQQRALYDWLVAHGEDVLTGDSFFHLAGYGDPLPGLNLCGAGRVVCLVDPVGDVYACPFAIHDEFLAGNVRSPGGFAGVWRHSDLFTELRQPQSAGACSSCGHYDACRGGCMAAKFFTGLPLDGPDPECVLGHGEHARWPPDRADAPALAGPLAPSRAGRR